MSVPVKITNKKHEDNTRDLRQHHSREGADVRVEHAATFGGQCAAGSVFTQQSGAGITLSTEIDINMSFML